MTRISRRSMIAGFAAGTALGVTPAVIANPIQFEDPATRVCRLSEELSIALGEWFGGQFRAIVEPGDDDGQAGKYWYQGMASARNRPTLPPGLSDMLAAWRDADARYKAMKSTGAVDAHPNSNLGIAFHDAGVKRLHTGFALLDALSGSSLA